jgi:hypothetical protein
LELEVARKAERQASKKVKQLEIEKRVAVKKRWQDIGSFANWKKG